MPRAAIIIGRIPIMAVITAIIIGITNMAGRVTGAAINSAQISRPLYAAFLLC